MTKLVGILNITPDSFSDGGHYSAVGTALARIEALMAEGAEVIDIGAESTRPGATPMGASEEWERLAPLFAAMDINIADAVILSLDTRHAENAKRALDKGFRWINDVSGFAQKTMVDTVRGYDCRLVMMHSLSVPADKNITLPADCDVMKTLYDFARSQCEILAAQGIARERIIFDPGVGFGKTVAQNWQIIERGYPCRSRAVPSGRVLYDPIPAPSPSDG